MKTDLLRPPVTPSPGPPRVVSERPSPDGALYAFLLDDSMDLCGPGSGWQAEFLREAGAIHEGTKARQPFARPGEGNEPMAAAFHGRSLAGRTEAERCRILAARALGWARDFGFSEVVFVLGGPDGPERAPAVAEGAVLASYEFRRYLSDPAEQPASVLLVEEEAAPEVAAAAALAAEVNRARDLINEPAEALTPEGLAAEARAIAEEHGLEVEILDEAALREQGYPGLISVGQGSPRPPRLIVLRHRPESANPERHLALVGKGITFDTGGVSLKPASGMWTMKGDMSGSAAVLRAMSAVAAAGVPGTVTAIVAAAENYPGPEATRPGDIFVARNGKSVMVDNTDAEGRLVLSDALARAGEEGATHIVDVATLTGSAVRALGTSVAAVMGNDPEWVRAVIEAGEPHGEAFWELPLVEEYVEQLRCDSADLKNIGGINAGAITAGLFLREFVPDGATWAHLDIAGPFLVEKPWKYYPKGATGFGVRTLYELATRFAAC